MVLTSILRRKSISEPGNVDIFDQLHGFLKDLERECLSNTAETTRQNLIGLLSKRKHGKQSIKRWSFQGASTSRFGSAASSLRSESPISPDPPESRESFRSVSTSPIVSPILSPAPCRNRVSFLGPPAGDDYEMDVDLVLNGLEEPETFVGAPTTKRFNRKPTAQMEESSSPRDQLMDLSCSRTFSESSASRDPMKAARSRHCSADDSPTEGHLEVREKHHWVVRWVYVKGNIVRVKETKEAKLTLLSVEVSGWNLQTSDVDNKWAIELTKPNSDERMMFATHTREARDKWIFSLNKCCSNDSLEAFRSNSMNGSTITLNTVDKIRDVKEEICFAEYKGYLREKTHMFQWTRRYCFVTKHSLYITLSEENLEPLFEIVLTTVTVNPDSELKKPYAFRLISTQIAKELFLAAESEEEYNVWLLVLSGKPVPKSSLSHSKVVRNEPAPPAPVSACKMREIAHTTGLLFRLQDRNWVCSWCARHHSNLFLYDSENSPLPYTSVKLTGSDVTTDLQHNIYKFLISSGNQENTTLTLGTENVTEFDRWCASFTMATTVRSRTATGSSSNRGDSFGRRQGSSDYFSAERLEDSNQSLPAERFTSGYGSAESMDSTGTGVYENYGKRIHSNRNSSEYEDYVNVGHGPPPVPQRHANSMVEQWVDNVNQIDEYDDDSSSSQPPQLPDKPRDDSLTSRDSLRDNKTPRDQQCAISLDDDDEDYAELPDRTGDGDLSADKTPTLSSDSGIMSAVLPDVGEVSESEITADSEITIPSVDVTSPSITDPVDDPVAVETSQQSEELEEKKVAQVVAADSFDLISDQDFEKVEREALVSVPSETGASRMSSTNELLVNQSIDFPFDEILDQLAEFSDPKLMDTLMLDSPEQTVSEPCSQPSDSSYEFASREAMELDPMRKAVEETLDDNAILKDEHEAEEVDGPQNRSENETAMYNNISDVVPINADSDIPAPAATSPTPDPEEKAMSDSEEVHGNVARLSSLDKLETWDSGMEESLIRTSQFLMEATADQEHRMYPDHQLLLDLAHLEKDSSSDQQSPASDMPSPLEPDIIVDDTTASPQEQAQMEIPKPKAAVSKLARPSGLAPPSRVPGPKTNGDGLRKSATSKSSDNVSGLPKSRLPSSDSKSSNSKITSPYGTMPRSKSKSKTAKAPSRSRQNSNEGSSPGPRASPSGSALPGPKSSPSASSVGNSGLRKNMSRESGLTTRKKTTTLPRSSRNIARPMSGIQKQAPAKVDSPRSRSSSQDSVQSSTSDRESKRRDSSDATKSSSLGRNNPLEKSMRRRLLSAETSKNKQQQGIRRLSTSNKRAEVARSPSYQGEESSVKRVPPPRATAAGGSSLPSSANSSPIPRLPAKARSTTLSTPTSTRSPSRPAGQSISPKPTSCSQKPATPSRPAIPSRHPAPSLRHPGAAAASTPKLPNSNSESENATSKSVLKPPSTVGSKLPKSGLAAPKSGLKTPASGIKKPSSGGIPRPTR